ncbi:ExeA family protein [Desulfofustis glycolicus]|jgi:type II secretory pathway predicted ATPase ExeA|uniref:Type II secretory pathway, component ExeA (Predicted ATPase) n=1 Tax=Desulfofustis glycolicus DSM 9705 TaxID=1121409 RepID=A0A1M5YYW1_9BACT|nr:AAA family ATPase [Desulfofustis glycolicus]SHI16733.1 Type II secretory pathway, component ExeA (predicted ATPase) [Desulfofustis glycolicus DSM 9705]
MSYRAFFGLAKEPFIADLPLDSVLTTPELLGVQQRLDYTLRLGAICLVTGEVGAGKSTALRWSCGQLHSSRYKTLWITASAGSILEVYRQLLAELDLATAASSRAVLTRLIRSRIDNLVSVKKQQPLVVIDEASLLRFDVFAELHTITQFNGDSKPWLPMVLAGQNNLAENLLHRTAIPLASRIVARSHLPAVDRQGMLDYLNHHLRIAGLKNSPFTEQAVTAVHQGSGGLFRKANHLARGALIAAAAEKSQEVSAEHVRLADSELF